MPSISQLGASIAGAARGVLAAFGFSSTKTNPKFVKHADKNIDVDAIQKERWLVAPEAGLYAFGVQNHGDPLQLDSSSLATFKALAADVRGALGGSAGASDMARLFTDFVLPISPQQIRQSEKFAVSIKPTQGGTVVNHSGNKYKDLVISGTTGVHPFKGITGVDILTGRAFLAPDELRYRSGYEVFLHLRMWMKSYHESKSKPGQGSARMIWKNYKDWEFLYVEPLSFEMERDASRPHLYNYTIQMRVLGHVPPPKANLSFLDEIDKGLSRAKQAVQTAKAAILLGQGIIRSTAGAVNSILENLQTLALAVKLARALPVTLRDVKASIYANFFSASEALALKQKVRAVQAQVRQNPSSAEALGVDLSSTGNTFSLTSSSADSQAAASSAASSGGTSTTSEEQKTLAEVIEEAGELADQITTEDFPPAAQAALQREIERVALLNAQDLASFRADLVSFRDTYLEALNLGDATYAEVFGRGEITPPDVARELTDEEFLVLRGFAEAEAAYDAATSSDELFQANAALLSRASSASGPDSLAQGVFSLPASDAPAREVVLPSGASLEDLALSELGDASRWVEIAEMNGLRSPYVDQAPTAGVTFEVRSARYQNPSDLQFLVPGYLFIVPATASGAWAGKAQNVAAYLGGDRTLASSWRFRVPEEGERALALDVVEALQVTSGVWTPTPEPSTFGVARAGDVLRLPSGAAVEVPSTRGRADNPLLRGLNATERSLGVDLALSEDRDLRLTPSGDLEIVRSVDNVGQAVGLKIAYRPGSLRFHPEVGAGLQVGAVNVDLGTVRQRLVSSLSADERVQEVRNVRLAREGGTVQVFFDIILRGVPEPVPVSLNL